MKNVKFIHIDLFAGIGGFSYAIDNVWGKENVEHIFVEIDKFCQAILKKHWKKSKYYGDIREYIKILESEKKEKDNGIFILTGGFPCQPFSVAGKRMGTQDNRYLWPEMFRVIQLTQPQWIITENVSGILAIEQGMVFEQVCSDLESENYEVQSFIIPAISVNAPHRRDRVWIVAHKPSKGLGRGNRTSDKRFTKDAQNSVSQRGRGGDENRQQVLESKSPKIETERPSWERNWVEVATELCGVDDWLPTELDELKLSKSVYRRERLKALGNAIVPQVAIEILKGIKIYDQP